MADSAKTRRAGRRLALKALAGAGLALPVVVRGQGEAQARRAAPRENDAFVFALGPRAGEPVTPADLPPGGRPVLAWPVAPETRTVRDGNRLNQVLLVGVDPSQLDERTRARAAGGIVAYSGVCTHTGCDITEWDGAAGRFQCPCHDSQFDPADNARVVGGPAPWQLAGLPLKLVAGLLLAAGGFQGRVGFLQPGTDPFGF